MTSVNGRRSLFIRSRREAGDSVQRDDALTVWVTCIKRWQMQIKQYTQCLQPPGRTAQFLPVDIASLSF
jgi:hypothetical protein